jgi:DNA polymerase-3 subunit delta
LIKRILASKKNTIEPKAVAMLVEFLGTNLSKINNELEVANHFTNRKLDYSKDEENIGFSKDFNVFELRKAIGEGTNLKHTLAENFKQSEREPHGGYH